MGGARAQVHLEGLEAGSLPSPEEPVLHAAEDLLGGAAVDAAALPGHALDDPGVLRPALGLGPERFGAALAVERAPSL